MQTVSPRPSEGPVRQSRAGQPPQDAAFQGERELASPSVEQREAPSSSGQPATIRIAGVVRQSIVDGPGLRFVVFTQGCPHGCSGCHNPESHDFSGGYACEIEKILEEMDKNPLLSGITLSGGEPFSRAAELIPLVQAVRARRDGKNVWCYSGYTLEELLRMAQTDKAVAELLRLLDVLVDGRFLLEERDLTLRFRGSRNQRVLNVAESLEKKRIVYVEGFGSG